MKRLVLLLVFFGLVAPQAFAADLQVCMNKKGQLVAKVKCSRGETKLTSSNLGGYGLQGPQGPQGPQGVQGPQGPQGSDGVFKSGINSNTCHLRTSDISGSAYGTSSVVCLVGETFISHGGFVRTGVASVSDVKLLTQLGTTDKVAGVEYGFYDPDGGSFSATVQAWCCAQPQYQ